MSVKKKLLMSWMGHRSSHIFHTIGEINRQEINARFHAQFRFDLHSFAQNILSFENSLF